ncbi:MAG: AMP-binding protein [Acidimicrobiales bacterium]
MLRQGWRPGGSGVGGSSPLFCGPDERHLDLPFLLGDVVLTYRPVYELGDEIIAPWASSRSLLFIDGVNRPASIAAYLAALRAGHVVHLLDSSKDEANRELIRRYAPTGVVHIDDDGAWRREPVTTGPHPALHPDLAVLLSTSGTTGSSKFVKLSYRNVAANTASIVEYLGLTADDRSITVLKPFYSYGYSVINTHAAVGGSLVLTDLSVQSPELWSLAYRSGITNVPGVPHTFQVMRATSIDWNRLDRLRFLTQAGGRMEPGLVRHFARLGEERGWSLFVMYGQTEGGPRLSYLPPSYAARYPESIGVAVPGGTFELVDDDGAVLEGADVEGELVYRGPNIMVGYARAAADLGTGEELPALHTGDIARRNDVGLYVITGRKSRFIKFLGLRIGLDEIESALEADGYRAAVAGTDEGLRVAVESPADGPSIGARLTAAYGLPAQFVSVAVVESLPRLTNGKVDYQSLLTAAAPPTRLWPALRRFVSQIRCEVGAILLGRETSVSDVPEAFALVFPNRPVPLDQSFVGLGGDSLGFVQLTVYLEELMDDLPADWPERSVADLQSLARSRHAAV